MRKDDKNEVESCKKINGNNVAGNDHDWNAGRMWE